MHGLIIEVQIMFIGSIDEDFHEVLEKEEYLTLVGETFQETEVQELLVSLLPDVVILDPRVIGTSKVFEYLEQLQAPTEIVLLVDESSEIIIDGLKDGAIGYIRRNRIQEDAFDRIVWAAKGGAFFDADVARRLEVEHRAGSNTSFLDVLTAQERRVLSLIRQSNKLEEVAEQIEIHQTDIVGHVGNIILKLQNYTKLELEHADLVPSESGTNEQRGESRRAMKEFPKMRKTFHQ